jgi:hypothetical protein
VWGRPLRLSDVDNCRLLGLKNKLICHFKLVVDMVGSGIQEFVNDRWTSILGKGAGGIGYG